MTAIILPRSASKKRLMLRQNWSLIVRRFFLVGILSVAIFSASAGAAINLLDLKVEYSAESVAGSGPNPQTGRLWRTPTALRYESTDSTRAQTFIVRFDRNTAWMLVPELKLVLETDLAALSQFSGLPSAGEKLNPVEVGPETIDGMRTTKYRVSADDPKAGWFRGFVWRTTQGVVLKIDGEGEHQGRLGILRLQFRNVRIGPQDPGLFEPPADFKRMPVSEAQIDTVLKGVEQMQRLRGGGTGPAR
jgi:hypothetical protein